MFHNIIKREWCGERQFSNKVKTEVCVDREEIERKQKQSRGQQQVCVAYQTHKTKLLHSNNIMKPFKTGFERPHNNQINIIDKKWEISIM